ncbi:MAG: TonB-dependent receptor plug domain-containing protein, partial [Marinobacter sp.]
MFRYTHLSLAVAVALVSASGAPIASAQGQGEPEMLNALNVTATRSGTKTDTPVIESPQSVSVIDREDWEEKGARSVQRAASYTPGVGTNQVGSSNRYDYLILRGFSDGSINNTYLDGLRVMNDGGSYSSFAIDPWFLERIEIVKGP